MKTTKLQIMLLFFLCSISTYGADLFVYPNAQSPDYANIQDALNAATGGDNIYIDTATFVGNVSISKSISLYPLHKGGMYTINGSLTLSFTNNRYIYIQGLSGGGVSFGTNNNLYSSDSASLVLNGCYFTSSVSLNNQNLYSFIYFSEFNSTFIVGKAELIGNTFQSSASLYCYNQLNFYKVKVYANTFYSTLNISNCNNTVDLHVANNYFSSYDYSFMTISGNSNSKANKVIIENNTLDYNNSQNYSAYRNIIITSYIEFLFIRNNYFDLQYNYITPLSTSGISFYDQQYNFCNYSISEGSGTIQTVANNTNGQSLNYSSSNQNNLGIVTSSQGIDAGSPLPECRDIDNTPNDIGTYGGPHSWENYHNSSTSMAQILDLEIPYYQIVLPGTQINFKSKAIHKNE